MTQLFQKITAHRIIRQQIKSLESLTAQKKSFSSPLSKDWFFFILLAQFFFLLLGPTTTFSAEAAFLLGGIEALHIAARGQSTPDCEKEGEAGWVEEEGRLGGSKEATAFAAGNPLVSESCDLPVYLPALSINWRIRTCTIIAKLQRLFSVPSIVLISLLLPF